jgi:LysE type translocator
MALALGIAAGSVLWALLTAAGLSALLASYAAAVTIIKIAGGLYLLWLAFKAFRAAASAHAIATTVDRQHSPRAYLLRGLAIQMTNPKAVLAWIAIIRSVCGTTRRYGWSALSSSAQASYRLRSTIFMRWRSRRPPWCGSTAVRAARSRRRLACSSASPASSSWPADRSVAITGAASRGAPARGKWRYVNNFTQAA